MNLDLQFLPQICSIGFKSGDCLGHSKNCILFLWDQFRVSFALIMHYFAFFVWLVVLLEGPSASYSQHSGRWQQIHLKNFPVHGSIPCGENQPHSMMLPPPNFTVGMVFLAISAPDMVCGIFAKCSIFILFEQTIFSQ